MKPTTVIVKNLFLEKLMKWFYESVKESGGDGAAIICCGNPAETADFFIKWWKKNHLPGMKRAGYKLDEFYHPRSEYLDGDGSLIVNYHDWNENFMFCDKKTQLLYGDISFFIEEDCISGEGHDASDTFKCLKVKE